LSEKKSVLANADHVNSGGTETDTVHTGWQVQHMDTGKHQQHHDITQVQTDRQTHNSTLTSSTVTSLVVIAVVTVQ